MKITKSLFLVFIGFTMHLSSCQLYNSADGQIAFIREDADNNFQIYTISPDGSESTQLTNIGENRSPVWSPDGSKIAFQSSQIDWGIFVMNRDGSDPIKLTNSMDDGAGPDWSPDGRKIAFVSRHEDSFSLFVINANGTERQEILGSLGKCNGFSWSPDGQKIAFSCFDAQDGYEIHTIHPDGSNEIKLTSSLQDSTNPKWSPNGKQLLYTSRPDEHFASLIYTMNADGSGQKRLTNDAGTQIEDNYSWSPDGNRILYSSTFEIYVIHSDGTDQTNLTASLDELCTLPTWSPDGQKVSFLCSPRQPDSHAETWIADVRNGNLEKVTNSIDGVGVPIWSPGLK